MGIFSQPTIPPLAPGSTFSNQAIMITGATGGIGYELSLQALRLGASDVILAVRSLQKGSMARLEMLADEQVRARNPGASIRVYEVDLGDYESVSTCAARVLREEKKLDCLILNAGINLAHFQRSASGNEMCMQVNLLSNALLSLLLTPLLQKSSNPRTTWLGSMGQAFHSLTANSPLPSPILSHYASPEKYARLTRYPDTKFFVGLFVREYAAHLPNSAKHVVVNNVCPGTVNTGADNALPFWLRWPMNLNRAVRARSVEDGARAVLCAVFGQVEGIEDVDGRKKNGVYVSNNAVTSLAPFADTPEGIAFGKQLWDEILTECNKVDEKVSVIWGSN